MHVDTAPYEERRPQPEERNKRAVIKCFTKVKVMFKFFVTVSKGVSQALRQTSPRRVSAGAHQIIRLSASDTLKQLSKHYVDGLTKVVL